MMMCMSAFVFVIMQGNDVSFLSPTNLLFIIVCRTKPVIIDNINNIAVIISALRGNSENMKKDSSPVVAINAAIKAGKLTTRCTYNDTAVYVPKQPGMIPIMAQTKI